MKTSGTVVQIPEDFDIQIKEYQFLILKRYGIKKTKAEIIQKFAQEALVKQLNYMNNGEFTENAQ